MVGSTAAGSPLDPDVLPGMDAARHDAAADGVLIGALKQFSALGVGRPVTRSDDTLLYDADPDPSPGCSSRLRLT